MMLLHRYGLVTHDPTAAQRAVRMHSLAQRATLETALPADLNELTTHLADALCEIWPETDFDPAESEPLRSNAMRLISRPSKVLWRPEVHPLIFQYAISATNTGLAREASDYATDLVEKCTRILGPDAVETLEARWLLTMAKAPLDPMGAVQLAEHLLDDQISIFGDLSEETFFTRWQLVLLRAAAGDHVRVVTEADYLLPLIDTAEEDGSDVFLVLVGTRAASLGSIDDPARALAELRETISNKGISLEGNNLSFIVVRLIAGTLLARSGQLDEAISSFQELLIDSTKTLGSYALITLMVRANLASLIAQKSRKDTPVVSSARSDNTFPAVREGINTSGANVASAVADKTAVTSLTGVLDDQLRVLGANHPQTFATRSELASVLGQTGDHAGALAAYRSLLEDQARVLGADHPSTLATRHQVAYELGQTRDHAGALAAHRSLLEDRARVMGADHPDTLTTRHQVAYELGQTRDHAGALAAHRSLLEDRARVLGADHPYTLTTRHWAAYELGQTGDHAGALAAYRSLLEDRARVLAPTTPTP